MGSNSPPVSATRKPSAIRALAPLMQKPGLISLGSGYPTAALFPVVNVEMTLADGSKVNLGPSDTASAMQYSPTPGLPGLVEWLTEWGAECGTVPTLKDGAAYKRRLLVTAGSQEALARTFEALLARGDTVLVEEPTYSGALAVLEPLGVNVVGIPGEDLAAGVAEKIASSSSSSRIKCLYCIPTGQNPSGHTLGLEQREGVLKVCRDNNIVILEDDPYRHLSWGNSSVRVPPTFAALDINGDSVVRFDSLSKVVAPGLRLGWATGPSPILDRVELHGQAHSLHASGLSQACALGLFREWGFDGFRNHLKKVAAHYQGRCAALESACDRYLKGVATWKTPTAGMFLWLHLDGVDDTAELVSKKCVEAGVLFVPGQSFLSPAGRECAWVRASFSQANDEDMNTAIERLAGLLAA